VEVKPAPVETDSILDPTESFFQVNKNLPGLFSLHTEGGGKDVTQCSTRVQVFKQSSLCGGQKCHV